MKSDIIKNNIYKYQWELSSIFVTPLRWIVGWTYFSAFWRRIVLENKLTRKQQDM